MRIFPTWKWLWGPSGGPYPADTPQWKLLIERPLTAHPGGMLAVFLLLRLGCLVLFIDWHSLPPRLAFLCAMIAGTVNQAHKVWKKRYGPGLLENARQVGWRQGFLEAPAAVILEWWWL